MRYFLLPLVFILFVGCAYHSASDRRLSTRIVVDSSLPEAARPAWLYYAGSRSLWVDKKFWEKNPGAAQYQYTFAEEVEARQSCAAVWRHMRESQRAKPEAYLDQLAAVANAGFIPEYTWTYFRDPSWAQPPDLRLSEFGVWRKTNLTDHKPETRARVELTDK
jgi:hypothetical protein